MKPYLSKLFERQALSQEEAQAAMDTLMRGEATPEEVGAFLGALRGKGEVIDEIVGFARSMRQHAKTLQLSRTGLVDTCGTGGDGTDTFNISTANALLIAAAGLAVVKHGNRAVSSRCGSADVLAALGIKIDQSPEEVAADVERFGFGFLFAPLFHPAMKHVAPVRRQLGVRTIFNLLGPLVNPANAKRQVIGVYDDSMLEPLAEALKELGSEEVMLVSGADGMDEITCVSTTRVAHLKNNRISFYTISPEDLGIKRAQADELKGGDPAMNAGIIEQIFAGTERGPKRDVVVINAAAALMVGGMVEDLLAGIKLAEEILDSGRALDLLNSLRVHHDK
ncbi:MAG: anthranilate phosphoribosyltransferase [Oligoflexus sp.]